MSLSLEQRIAEMRNNLDTRAVAAKAKFAQLKFSDSLGNDRNLDEMLGRIRGEVALSSGGGDYPAHIPAKLRSKETTITSH